MSKRMSRRLILSAIILTFWAVMMAVLISRHESGLLLPAIARGSAAENGPSFSAMAISTADGQRVGTMRIYQVSEQRHGRKGQRLGLSAELTLRLLGSTSDLAISGGVWRPHTSAELPSPKTPNAEFDFVVTASGQQFEVEGNIDDDGLKGSVTTGGERLPLEIPLDGKTLFASGFGSPLRFPVLEIGETYRFESFDPITLSANTATVFVAADEELTIGARQIPCRRLEVDVSGLETTAWVDLAGEVVRAETAFGLTVERLAGSALGSTAGPRAGRQEGELSEAGSGDDESEDLLALTAIVPTGLRPFRGAREMIVSLTGVEGALGSLEANSTRAQAVLDDGRVRLSSSAPGLGGSTDETSKAAHLEGDAFVQSHHDAIRTRSAQIVAQLEIDWDKARAIHTWVYRNVEKVPILGIPSALEVLRDPRGDCNEHTVLFTALARAAGVPTRIAIGVVWSDELDAFYYHAWPEVFVGEPSSWVAMDPTLDQEVADATHLKILNGGIESWPRLLPYLGRLEIDVASVE